MDIVITNRSAAIPSNSQSQLEFLDGVNPTGESAIQKMCSMLDFVGTYVLDGCQHAKDNRPFEEILEVDAGTYDDYCRNCWPKARPLTPLEAQLGDSDSGSESSSTNAESD